MYNQDLKRIEQMPYEIKDENFLKLTKNGSFSTLLSLNRVVHPMLTFSFSGAQSLRSSARRFLFLLPR